MEAIKNMQFSFDGFNTIILFKNVLDLGYCDKPKKDRRSTYGLSAGKGVTQVCEAVHK